MRSNKNNSVEETDNNVVMNPMLQGQNIPSDADSNNTLSDNQYELNDVSRKLSESNALIEKHGITFNVFSKLRTLDLGLVKFGNSLSGIINKTFHKSEATDSVDFDLNKGKGKDIKMSTLSNQDEHNQALKKLHDGSGYHQEPDGGREDGLQAAVAAGATSPKNTLSSFVGKLRNLDIGLGKLSNLIQNSVSKSKKEGNDAASGQPNEGQFLSKMSSNISSLRDKISSFISLNLASKNRKDNKAGAYSNLVDANDAVQVINPLSSDSGIEMQEIVHNSVEETDDHVVMNPMLQGQNIPSDADSNNTLSDNQYELNDVSRKLSESNALIEKHGITFNVLSKLRTLDLGLVKFGNSFGGFINKTFHKSKASNPLAVDVNKNGDIGIELSTLRSSVEYLDDGSGYHQEPDGGREDGLQAAVAAGATSPKNTLSSFVGKLRNLDIGLGKLSNLIQNSVSCHNRRVSACH